MKKSGLKAAGLAVLFLFAAGAAVSAQEGESTTYNGHKYTFFETGCSWEEAKSFCEEQGGHLATISSRGEQKAIRALLKSGKKSSYWIGGFKELVSRSSRFKWITGEKFSYSEWVSGSPDDTPTSHKDALMIYRSSGGWKDESGDKPAGKASNLQKFGFICEWEDDISDISEPVSSKTEKEEATASGSPMGVFLNVDKRVKLFAPAGTKWSSSNADVAKVNSNGVVTGVSEGTAIITAKGLGSITVLVME